MRRVPAKDSEVDGAMQSGEFMLLSPLQTRRKRKNAGPDLHAEAGSPKTQMLTSALGDSRQTHSSGWGPRLVSIYWGGSLALQSFMEAALDLAGEPMMIVDHNGLLGDKYWAL